MQVSARIGRGLAVAAGALLMLWPAILNRYPLMYPDSIGYLGDGRPLARILFRYAPKGYPAMRSEFYSLGIFPFHWNLTPWPIVVWQALLTSWVLWLTLRSVLPQRTARRFAATFLILVALLSLLTSVSWYVSLPMPDILGPLLYLAIYLLVFARETLSRGERRALSALAFWAITAHSTHLMLGVGICFLLALLRFWPRNWVPHVSTLRRGFSTTGLAHIALLIAIAIAAQLALHRYHNGHPDLLLGGKYPNNCAKAGDEGVEIKTTRKKGGAVDTHGGRNQWMCVFVYHVDNASEPAQDRRAMRFTELYLSYVGVDDFRKNPRGELGTRTATLDREGIKKLRANWIYKLEPA